MALGQIIGGKLGAHLAIKKGASLIRPIFIVIVFSTLSVLFYRNYVMPKNLKILFLSFFIICIFAFLMWNFKSKYFKKSP